LHMEVKDEVPEAVLSKNVTSQQEIISASKRYKPTD
jgi:hypothetical protein